MKTKLFIICPAKNWCSKESFSEYDKAERVAKQMLSPGERYFVASLEGSVSLSSIQIPEVKQ
jgi:hypothetical protein